MANFEFSRTIYARPFITNVSDTSWTVQELPKQVNITGRMLGYTQSIYLSASNSSYLSSLQYFDPFNGRATLSSLYPPFSAQRINDYIILDNNTLSAVQINDLNIDANLSDVNFRFIIENPAGYNVSEDVYVSQFIQSQILNYTLYNTNNIYNIQLVDNINTSFISNTSNLYDPALEYYLSLEDGTGYLLLEDGDILLVSPELPSYDVDAQDYFNRAEALQPLAFDLTDVDSLYTETYVKTAINNFIVTCKADGTWSKLTEVYLLCGVQFGALTAKLKYDSVATLTNHGFVSGDYLAAGSGAGLTGDGSSYLDTSFLDSSLSADNKSFGRYQTVNTVLGVELSLGVRDGTAQYSVVENSATQLIARVPSADATVILSSIDPKSFLICSRRGVNDVEVYLNGSSAGTDTSTAAGPSISYNWHLFAYNNAGFATNPTNTTNAFMFLGTGLSDTEAANLTTATEALMDALGCGVIP